MVGEGGIVAPVQPTVIPGRVLQPRRSCEDTSDARCARDARVCCAVEGGGVDGGGGGGIVAHDGVCGSICRCMCHRVCHSECITTYVALADTERYAVSR